MSETPENIETPENTETLENSIAIVLGLLGDEWNLAIVRLAIMDDVDRKSVV